MVLYMNIHKARTNTQDAINIIRNIFMLFLILIRENPMNRSRSSSKSLFFVFFFHCIFTPIVFGAADPFTQCQGSRTPKTGRSQADCPNSYSCSPATGGTSNFIRLKGPILCDVLSAGANSHYTDQDPFTCPVNLKYSLRSF